MSEPRLENIEDYDTLKGEKKRVVWSVVLAGLTIGVIYAVAYNYYDNKEESLTTQESYKTAPMK